MKTKAAKLFLIPTLLVLIGLSSYPISLKSSDGNEIIEVIILGNRRIETQLIKSALSHLQFYLSLQQHHQRILV